MAPRVENQFTVLRQWAATQMRRPRFWIMPGILALGLGLRLAGLDFGLPNDSRPDEINILNIVLNNLLDAMQHGDWSLHPHFLNYPSLYFYLMAVVYAAFYGLGLISGWFANWNAFLMAREMDPTLWHLILRGFSAVAGTALIAMMAALARRFTRHQPHRMEISGWMAALLAATNYLLVRNSHFGSVDMLLTLGITGTLWAILGYMQTRSQQALTRACIACGLTIGVKYPAILLLFPLWVAIFQPFVSDDRIDWAGFLHAVWKPTGLALLVFLATTPWLLLDFPEFLRDLQYEAGYFFTLHLPGLPSGWLFYPGFTLFSGVGGLSLLFALLGIGMRLHQRDNGWEDAAMLSFLVGFLLLLGFNERLMTRYALPLVPVLLLYASVGILSFCEILSRCFASSSASQAQTRLESTWMLAGVVLTVVLIQPTLLSYGFDTLMQHADTRTQARDWILAHVPPNTPVATGPRLGQLYLPGNYGQLIASVGTGQLQPPARILVQDLTPRTRMINSYGDLDVLKQMGIRYVVAYEGLPFFSNRPWEMAPLARNARLVARFSPLKPNMPDSAVGSFDPMDAFFLPYDDFHAFERPGPIVDIFDLAQPPLLPQPSGSPNMPNAPIPLWKGSLRPAAPGTR